MNNPQIDFKLPHLLLWRKGWYRYSKEYPSLIKTIKKCLKLDGYEFAESTKDITSIVMGAFDEFCKECDNYKLYRPGFQQIYINTKDKYDYHRWYYANDSYYAGVDFEICIVLTILDYIAWYESAKVKIIKPHFDRKLYKKGLKFGGMQKTGMTYKEINNYVNTFKW